MGKSTISMAIFNRKTVDITRGHSSAVGFCRDFARCRPNPWTLDFFCLVDPWGASLEVRIQCPCPKKGESRIWYDGQSQAPRVKSFGDGWWVSCFLFALKPQSKFKWYILSVHFLCQVMPGLVNRINRSSENLVQRDVGYWLHIAASSWKGEEQSSLPAALSAKTLEIWQAGKLFILGGVDTFILQVQLEQCINTYEYNFGTNINKHQQTSTDMLHEWSIYHFFLVIFGVFLQTLACYEGYGHMLGKWLPQRAEVIFVAGDVRGGAKAMRSRSRFQVNDLVYVPCQGKAAKSRS